MNLTKRRVLISLSIVVGMLIMGEVVSREKLGLGDPPLYLADPQIEYLSKPGTYHRFGHLISFNRYSMRAEDFPEHKSKPRELRVMVIGDSIVYGGVQLDQSQIATKLLENDLSAKLKRPVTVGNISAGSWGPPNQLAYVKRFGLFDADAVVIVLSSHDYSDVPTFMPIVDVHPSFPGHKPDFALQEGVTRYLLPRILPATSTPTDPISNASNDPKNPQIAMKALRGLVRIAQKSGAKVLIAQHLEKIECEKGFKPEHDVILQEARALKIPVIQLGDEFKAALKRGDNPYLDAIHANALGQILIKNSIEPKLLPMLINKNTS